jgi:homoserine O-succinyltransferase/O-acetyltransferase
MPLLLDTVRAKSAADPRGRNCLTVGLVNNMPDAACEATERQFVDLLRAAAGDVVVRLRLFAIGDVPRADAARQEFAGRYRDIAEVWDRPLDGLIVTGTEPRAPRLQDEPYWPALTRLVDWARENTASTVWSCLAAHAAVLHADGIERRPFAEKLSGVFDCDVVTAHPLLSRFGPGLRVPHSRINDLPEASLAACGYGVLTRSAAAGVDAFVGRETEPSLFLFFQGHPEYDADSMLREYRRDVGRFLRFERECYPKLPHGYLGDEASVLADDFRARAIARRDTNMISDFPMDALAAGIKNSWHGTAVRIYRNWIEYLNERNLNERKTARGRSALPVRQSRSTHRRIFAG